MSKLPRADWYPDPEHSGQLRYWDGRQWTEHRAPMQQPAPNSAIPPSVQPQATHQTAQPEAAAGQMESAAGRGAEGSGAEGGGAEGRKVGGEGAPVRRPKARAGDL